MEEKNELGEWANKTMKQKRSFLHQIGFFRKDKEGNDIESDFEPFDFSLLTLQDLGLDDGKIIEGNDFGMVQDLQRQTSSWQNSKDDHRPNWAKASYPANATKKICVETWPREYTSFQWPEEEEGKRFSWLTVAETRRFDGCFVHLRSFLWNVLHDYQQKHKKSTVTEAKNRQISPHKFYSAVEQMATYFRNLWTFCIKFEGNCPGWLTFLSAKRMRAFHEYCRFRAGSPNTANNKAKYTQQVCEWLLANVPCLHPFGGELWIVGQQAGHFRRLMKQQQQVKLIDRPTFRERVKNGKAITAEQLKMVHATVFTKLRKSMEVWNERVGLLPNHEVHKIAYKIQGWLQMICHFKIGAQRQEVIIHMTRKNFTYDRERQCYILKPDFKEKRLRKFVNEMCFPADCNPFFKFFLERVRMFLRRTDVDPDAIWLSYAAGLPQDPSAMTTAISSCCSKIIPGSHMTSRNWRHLLITLAYLDDYLAGHSDQQKFLSLLANVQNHDVSTLMHYYNDADINKQADQLINSFNRDYLQTEQSIGEANLAKKMFSSESDAENERDSEDEILDDLQSMSDEETIYSDRYRAVGIKGKMFQNGKLLYWVQWEKRDPTWEKLTNLKHYLNLVEDYEVDCFETNLALANLEKKNDQKKRKRPPKKPRENGKKSKKPKNQ